MILLINADFSGRVSQTFHSIYEEAASFASKSGNSQA